MKLLLDTQCWLWWFTQPERLNQEAIAQIADETNALWLSVASIWEMGIKVAIGKLPLPEPLESYLGDLFDIRDPENIPKRQSRKRVKT